MIGQTISHYRILEKLGEGGMGVVYKAHDSKLDRIVALKFLPHHLTASDAEQARFMQEAKAAASLNHPNVCSIYRIEEHGGQQFIEMEFVDGLTLKRKLQSTALKTEDVIAYAIQIGDALQEAHNKGIVHRDIKAENIMVNEKNQIKVMDFGLAKLKGSLKLTKTSSTVGTLAYMAPEQIQGGNVDARSDIFSFGIVLFEMLTGKTPFRGEHEAALMYSILNEEPEPIQKYVPDASPELVHIMSKALDKDPETRYQSAADMIADLRRAKKDSTRVHRSAMQSVRPEDGRTTPPFPTARTSSNKNRIVVAGAGIVILVALAMFIFEPGETGSGTSGRKTLAVIPFENQGTPEKDYFADGITDEITSRLSTLSGLGVIARSSAREYKKTAKSVRQIGEELGVEYILMGTVRWTGGDQQRVRVNPELIKVSNALQIWSQPFEAAYSDAFTIQSNIASEVAQALDVKLVQGEGRSLEGRLTSNPRAYDYYLKGKEYNDRGLDRAGRELAIQMWKQAIDEDPGFAAAYARISRVHSLMYWLFYDRTESRVEMARDAADRAIALGPTEPLAYAAKGWYYYHCRLDYQNALAQFNLALKYQPNNAEVHYGIAAVQRRQGRIVEAVESYQRSLREDPRSGEMNRQLGETLTLARRYQEAEEAYEKAIILAPDNLTAYFGRALNVLLLYGNVARTKTLVDEALARGETPSIQLFREERPFLELACGDFERALQSVKACDRIDNQFRFRTRELLLGEIELFLGDQIKATRHFASAREELERLVTERPEDERIHSALGVVYAGLGRKEDAIREGLKGLELLPVEKEAWRGGYRLMELAKIYTIVGEQEKAIEVLKRLLSIPADISRISLSIDPTWKSLRGNKHFQELVQAGS